MPWNGLQWWTRPGTCTWGRQSRPQLWPPVHPVQAGWAPRQEAECHLCSCSLFAHTCFSGKTCCFYHKTWRGRRGRQRQRPSTGQGCCWVHYVETRAGREGLGGGRWTEGRKRGQERQTETWRCVWSEERVREWHDQAEGVGDRGWVEVRVE